MAGKGLTFLLKEKFKSVDIKLLLFLLLFLNVKLAVKAVALIIVFCMEPNFKLGLRLKNSRLPLFYIVAPLIVIINFIFQGNFSGNYTVVSFTAIAFWIASLLVCHRVKSFTEQIDPDILKNTIAVFLLLNVAFSFFDLFVIFTEIGIRNPFHYQGEYQKYFINTGDHIRGVLFDVSTTNAVINCFGIIYFLYQKKYIPLLACMTALILTASNTANFMLFIVFIGLFCFRSDKVQKSIMAICMMMLVIFLAKLSPQNNSYLSATINKYIFSKEDTSGPKPKIIPLREMPDSLLTPEKRKEKAATLFLDSVERGKLQSEGAAVTAIVETRPEIPKDSIHTASFQWRRDTTAAQRQLIAYFTKRHNDVNAVKYKANVPGKILAFEQSYTFLRQHPARLIMGTGAANFSSKLAFRATGLSIAGGFPQRFLYCNEDFLNNHLSLYSYFFIQKASEHSVIHNPASVYDQLLTEYGLIGVVAFLFYYAGFFFKQRKRLSYGIPLLFIMLAAFGMDYWFEQLSIVILFELMLFTDIKDPVNKKA